MIGGIGEIQETLDFCAGHGIVSDIENRSRWRHGDMATL